MKKLKRTPRGFAVYGSVVDARGNTVRAQRSSEIGAPRCWLFVRNELGHDHELTPAPGIRNGVDVVTPYLSRKQARRLAHALLAFAEGVE